MPGTEEDRKAEIKRQISLLQSQLEEPTPKRKGRESPEPSPVLAPATPSPSRCLALFNKLRLTTGCSLGKKRKLNTEPPSVPLHASSQNHQRAKQLPTAAPAAVASPTPSTLLSKLAQAKARSDDDANGTMETSRSSGFSERAAALHPTAQTRDERGVIIDDIPIGPVEHIAPFDDPRYERLEPNSGIRLL